MTLINDLFDYKETNNSRSISTRACACYNQGICDPYTGLCICPSGFLGQQCEQLARKIRNLFFIRMFFCNFQQRLYVIMSFVKIQEYATYSQQLYQLVGVY